jgi:tetratricopeptide (TPR) repeat protein
MSQGTPDDGGLFGSPGGGRRPVRGGGGFGLWAILLGGAAGTAIAVGAFLLIQSHNAGTPDMGEAADCLGQGNLQCAEADYRAVLAKQPDDPSANSLLAIALARDDKDREAIPYFKRALALGVTTYDFYETYGASLRKLGDLDGAIGMDEAALKLRPTLNDIRARLADELVQRGRGPEALALLQSYDKDLTDNYRPPAFTAQIARIQAQIGHGPAVGNATQPPPAG